MKKAISERGIKLARQFISTHVSCRLLTSYRGILVDFSPRTSIERSITEKMRDEAVFKTTGNESITTVRGEIQPVDQLLTGEFQNSEKRKNPAKEAAMSGIQLGRDDHFGHLRRNWSDRSVVDLSQNRLEVKGFTMQIASRLMVVTTCLFVCVTSVFAQTRPVWQQKSDYLNNGPAGYSASPGGYSAYSAGTRLYDARQYTQQLYDYTQCSPAPQLQPAITKVESEHIGQTMQAAKQNLAVVKKEAEKSGDKTILKKLESIDKHLVAAMEHHKKMHMECCKDEINGKATGTCCDELMTELDKALAEHASLMRLLGGMASTADSKPVNSGTQPVQK